MELFGQNTCPEMKDAALMIRNTRSRNPTDSNHPERKQSIFQKALDAALVWAAFPI